jgi:hypothetical protein
MLRSLLYQRGIKLALVNNEDYQSLMKKNPSGFFNSALIQALRITLIVLALALLIIGSSWIFSGLVNFDDFIFDFALEKESSSSVSNEDLKRLKLILGIVTLILSLVMLLTARLCKLIIQRNNFISDFKSMYLRESSKKNEESQS